jgi:hypothetical protein
MTYEIELKELCEDFICMLDELRVKNLISDEELEAHSEKNLNSLKYLMFNNN